MMRVVMLFTVMGLGLMAQEGAKVVDPPVAGGPKPLTIEEKYQIRDLETALLKASDQFQKAKEIIQTKQPQLNALVRALQNKYCPNCGLDEELSWVVPPVVQKVEPVKIEEKKTEEVKK